MEENILLFDCAGLEDGGTFPIACTGRGEDRSPAFLLRNLSPAAKTLAITLEDLSHPIQDFTHWVIWNLPAQPQIPGGIPAGRQLPDGTRQGLAYGRHRYAGPKPPRGKRHTYRFTVYALDHPLELPSHATKKRFLAAAKGHILQIGSLTGVFE